MQARPKGKMTATVCFNNVAEGGLGRRKGLSQCRRDSSTADYILLSTQLERTPSALQSQIAGNVHYPTHKFCRSRHDSLLRHSQRQRANLRLKQLLQCGNLCGNGTTSSSAANKLLCSSFFSPVQGLVQGLYQDKILPVAWHSCQDSFQSCCCLCLCACLGCFNAAELLLPVTQNEGAYVEFADNS